MRIFSKLRWIIILLVVGILALLGLNYSLRAPVASITLPDGSVLRVEAVTYGTNHVVGPDTSWRLRLLKRIQNLGNWFMPVGRQLLLTEGQSRLETAYDTAVLWVSWYNPANAQYLNAREIIPVLRDEHGCGFRPAVTSFYDFSGSGIQNNFNRAAFVFDSLPASQKRFDAEFCVRLSFPPMSARSNGNPCAQIRNPRFRKPFVWRANALPATQTVQAVKIVLDSLEVRTNSHGNGIPYWSLVTRGRAESLLNPPAQWEPPLWTFEDSVGNRGPEFCEYEPVIKCIAAVYPSSKTDLPNTKRVQLSWLKPPLTTHCFVWQTNMQCGEASFHVLGLWGPGTYAFQNGMMSEIHLPQAQQGWHSAAKFGADGRALTSYIHSSTNHVLFLQNVKLGDRQRLQLRVKDDHNRLLYAGVYATDIPARYANGVVLSIPEAPGLRTASLVKRLVAEMDSASFAFHLPPNVEKATLEFSVINPRRAEFFVKPPFYKGKM